MISVPPKLRLRESLPTMMTNPAVIVIAVVHAAPRAVVALALAAREETVVAAAALVAHAAVATSKAALVAMIARPVLKSHALRHCRPA